MSKNTFDRSILKQNRHRSWLPIFNFQALLLIVLLSSTGAVFAQNLSYMVPELRMQVYVQPDASARIVYDITFANLPSGDVIDIIDIGTPHDGYDLNMMYAELDGHQITDIRPSEVIDTGVEIHLRDQAISPGQEGTLHFEFLMPDLVFQDTTDGELASLQISPTWFDGPTLVGSTDLWILIHMLPEVQADEVLFQDVPFTDKVIFDEHPVAVWRWENGNVSGENLVGVSFPQRGMTRVIEQSLFDITQKWLEDNPTIRFILVGITLILFAIAFFRFTGGTGITIFVLVAVGLAFLMIQSPSSVLLALPVMTVLVGLSEYTLSKRKKGYLPAISQVEGGGIKRGLTAPEAAIILEIPLNKVLTLIIFGLLEKRIIREVQRTPLVVEVSPEYKVASLDSVKERRKQRLAVAQQFGVVVRSYEHYFLDLIEEQESEPIHKISFDKSMASLIRSTADRMKGFDLSDTQDYYNKIIAKAMKEAKSIGEIPERERYLDRHLQWLLLDDDYPDVLTTRRYIYRPIWVRPFTSSDRIGTPSALPGPSGASYGGRTSTTDVAASFAGWTQNTMGNMASAITPGFLQVKGAGGAVNLGGVDKVTGDIFKALATSSGSGSSSGGSCACACAGCACACACAGGGR